MLYSQDKDKGGNYNIAINGKTGSAEFNNATMRGKVFASEGEIGKMKVDGDGEMVIYDGNNKVLSLTKQPLPTIADLLVGNEDATTYFGVRALPVSTSLQSYSTASHIVKNTGAQMWISGSVTMAFDNQDSTTDGTWTEVRVYLSGSGGGNTVLLASGACGSGAFLDGSSSSSSIDYSTSLNSVNAGTYCIKVDYVHVQAGNGKSTVSMSSGSISSKKVSSANQSILGRGLAVAFSATEYLHYAKIGSESPLLTYKGKTDMPGVLAAGSVGKSGTYAKKWGAKIITGNLANRDSLGKYTLQHNIGHSNYTTTITRSGVPSSNSVIFSVAYEYSNSVVVYAHDGMDTGRLVDCAFNFTIVGNN